MMPKHSGITVCKEIKKNSSVKVLMLTAKSESEDELAALQSGADEYVKPFHPGVLITRAKKLIQHDDVIQVQDLKIDFTKNKVYKMTKS